ncbi:unnamed protein product [Meganyctiphanes norvegica]|uniref:Uncharacterized protein n=1 Tax=Meganyctiphanes norvegica TaxID=48144 RepID=A0AAV2RCG4_MEGNR
MKIVVLLAVVGVAVCMPYPQGVAAGAPKRKLWLKIDDNSLEVFNPHQQSYKSNTFYNKVNGKAVPIAVQPSYYYGSSEELWNYGSPSVAYAQSQFKSNPTNTQEGNPNFYYDNSGELKMIPDPAMFSQVYSNFYSNLPVQGPNAPRYYIDSSGEVGVASDFFMNRLFRSNTGTNLYRDNSGELLYVYPQGSGPGSSPGASPSGSAPGGGAVLTA